jgi:hypothetical protein
MRHSRGRGGIQHRDRGKPEPELRGRGTQIVAKWLSARPQLSKGVQMVTAAREYRNKAAACLQLSKTMNDDNRRRLEDIARRWIELAKEEELAEQEYFEAAECGQRGCSADQYRTAP